MKSATKLVRKYLCELCIGANPYREPKAFTRKGDLTRHQNTHTGKRAYRCNFIGCGKKFSQAAGLKTHVNVHTGEKPYTCGLGDCKSSFGDPSSCARHRKETHRRPAGYRCPVEDCKTSIKRKSVFTEHLSKKHGLTFQDDEIESCLPLSLPKLPNDVPSQSSVASSSAVSSQRLRTRSLKHKPSTTELDNIWNETPKGFRPTTPTYGQGEETQFSEPYLSWTPSWGQDHYNLSDDTAVTYDHRMYSQYASSVETTPSTTPTSSGFDSHHTEPIYQHPTDIYKTAQLQAVVHGDSFQPKNLFYNYNATLANPYTTAQMGIDLSSPFAHPATSFPGPASTGAIFYNYS